MDSAKVYGILATSFLLLMMLGDPTTACSCAPRHPQSAYCNADIVIKAKFVGVTKELVNISIGEPVWWMRHEIKTTKVYKAPAHMQDVQFLYTPAMESVCGYEHKGTLKGEEYIITGMLEGDRVMITACSFIQPWAQLSVAQKRGLSSEYSKGCNCTVVPCIAMPCFVSSNNQCLWTDGIISRIWDDFQAKRLACLSQSESPSLCTWQSLSIQEPGSLRRARLRQ
ncbi:metalloproteinase inhibitor 1 [Varanus komodoensis]|uniref:Metalloproteinase inhibitor 1 n=1 Tax=Varanus komodoensis TaxID=61221 RepID=A0A8D2JEG8_VARKO|nr:metalloproteinase inhibitor 1 [Varanus komodoensis]XP_044287410.1 metalloproteinase inhibitor 1 [Varanus komodoensis]XP_044287411.1 metalloproteinase inhibitor 1 [Varanus komodoensis]XP_044287412.1 metalloproteinase inhibitor 1 [Varanus komodoensis]